MRPSKNAKNDCKWSTQIVSEELNGKIGGMKCMKKDKPWKLHVEFNERLVTYTKLLSDPSPRLHYKLSKTHVDESESTLIESKGKTMGETCMPIFF